MTSPAGRAVAWEKTIVGSSKLETSMNNVNSIPWTIQKFKYILGYVPDVRLWWEFDCSAPTVVRSPGSAMAVATTPVSGLKNPTDCFRRDTRKYDVDENRKKWNLL